MDKITTVGVDLAKQVMAVHAADAAGRMVMRKVLRRDQLLRWTATLSPCVVAMEACGGAHYWARELTRQGAYGAHHRGGIRAGVSQERQERRQ